MGGIELLYNSSHPGCFENHIWKRNALLQKRSEFQKRNSLVFPPYRGLSVPRVGIEPTRPKTLDFESSASTSSATEAKGLQS